jgi:carbonyl reductase 1
LKEDDPTPSGEQAKKMTETNFTAVVNSCNVLFPLLKPNARVVNVSSGLGMLKFLRDEHIRVRFASGDLSLKEITNYMNRFVE